MVDLLSVYHSLPYPFRVAIASTRGFQLRWRRYKKETEKLVEEALVHEKWTNAQWEIWREEHLALILNHAATNVPYYRDYWQKLHRQNNKKSWSYLENWPVLPKDEMRNNPSAFIADHINLCRQVEEHTSGTTGKPLTIWKSKDSIRQWYALFEGRWRGWYGLSRHDRWGIVGGQLVTPFSQNTPPFWVWNFGLNQLYFSSYHLAPQNISAYLNAIKKYKLIYLLGYASSLYSLAQLALEQNLDVPALKAVISNAEPLYQHQREIIAKVFQCPVFDTYGLSEDVCAASECLHGNLHLWPEVGVTEILNEDSDLAKPAGNVGRIICTGLLNQTMPLIRYDVGDRGFLSAQTNCACGCTLPILGGIEGRKDDVIITKDGRYIGRLDPVFKSDLPIREAQIIQESLNLIRVLYVPASGFSDEARKSLINRLQERVGDIQIEIEAVDQIPRTSNGKFRAVISNVSSK